MRKSFSLLFACLALVAGARQISSDEAAAIASDFLGSSTAVKKAAAAVNVRRAQAKGAPRDAEENQPYYIFNADDDNGFVIIAGDDRSKKILGYSDTGNFDLDNMPPQLAAMLDQYAGQIAKLTADTADPSWSAPSRSATDGGEGVLLETANWGQGYPYNAQCPVIDGVQAPTGCVATAMAIVMKYHNWPEKTANEYYTDFYNVDMSFDFSKGSFNWEGLNDSNSSDYVTEISKLNKAAGVSIDTEYDKDESAAVACLSAHELSYRFGYSTSCQAINSDHFTHDDWHNNLIGQLNSGWPVIYAASTHDNIGHAFVIDGYEGSNYHINWGWDGICNGFFDIDALNVNGLNFTNNHLAIINAFPGKNEVFKSSEFVVNDSYYTCGDNPLVSVDYFNCSNCDVNLDESKFEVVCPSLLLPHFSNQNETLRYWYMFGLAIMDNNYNLKYIIPRLSTADEYYTFETNNIMQSRLICRLSFDDILDVLRQQSIWNPDFSLEEDDIFQLIVSDEYGEGEYKIVQGTMHSPSYFNMTGNKIVTVDYLVDHDENFVQFSDYNGKALKYSWIRGRYYYGGGKVEPTINWQTKPAYTVLDKNEGYVGISTIATEPEYHVSLSLAPQIGLIESLSENQVAYDGVVYEKISDEDAYINSYGVNSASVVGFTRDLSTNVIIRNSVLINGIDMPVRKIEGYSFYGSNIKHVTITSNLHFFFSAFVGCNTLESVTLDDTFNCSYYMFMSFRAPNLKYIYDKSPNQTAIEQDFHLLSRHEQRSIDVFYSQLDDRVFYNWGFKKEINNLGINYVPGGLLKYLGRNNSGSYYSEEAIEFLNIKELWKYEINRKDGIISIIPLIEGIEIDRVTVNGREVVKGDGGIYYYDGADDVEIAAFSDQEPLDVIVDYTLHGRQAMTTHYDAEFNAAIPDDIITGVSQVPQDDAECFDIYNLQGICVKRDATRGDVDNLAPGLYIVNGQKVIVGR